MNPGATRIGCATNRNLGTETCGDGVVRQYQLVDA